jgi:hypothetical protein
MRREKQVVMTTRVDAHNSVMSRESLEDAVSMTAGQHLPMLIEHELRNPPIGRWWPSEVIPESDGEFALVGEFEYFEPGATPARVLDRKFIPSKPEGGHPDQDRSRFLTAGKPHPRITLTGRQPGLEAAVSEPPDLIVIGGLFLVGQAARASCRHWGPTPRPDPSKIAELPPAATALKEQHFKLDLYFEDRGVQVPIIHDSPTSESRQGACPGIAELTRSFRRSWLTPDIRL